MIANPIARRWYITALFGYFGLFFLLMLWNTLLAPSTRFPVTLVLIFSIGPMLIPLRGFLDANTRNCSWLAYISLFYFIHGIGEAYANSQEQGLAILEIVFSLLLFFGATYYVRYHARI